MIPSVPEEAAAAEEAVIGSVLMRGWESFDTARELKDTDFGQTRMAAIWRAVSRLAATDPDAIADIVQVEQQLTAAGEIELVGGIVGLNKIDRYGLASSSKSYLRRHVATVKLYSARRQTWLWHRDSSGEIEDEAELTSPEAWNSYMKRQAAKVSALAAIGSTDVPIRGSDEVAQELARRQYDSIKGVGNRVCLGFPSLDSLMCARTKNLCILGGRPSHGKSALMMSLIREMNFQRRPGNWVWGPAENPTPTFIVPAEMPAADLAARLVADLSSVDTRIVAAPDLDTWRTYGDQMTVARRLLAESQITWAKDDDAPFLDRTISAIRRWRAMTPGPVAVVFIDYLQLLRARNPDGGPWDSEDMRNSWVAEELKRVAVEIDLLIVLVSSTNRNVAKREDKWPIISDLRHAGGADFHADQIIFAHQPAKYGAAGFKRDEWPREFDSFDAAETALEHANDCIARGTATDDQRRIVDVLAPLMRRGWIPVVKARNGKVGSVRALWDAPFTRWSEPPALAA